MCGDITYGRQPYDYQERHGDFFRTRPSGENQAHSEFQTNAVD